MLERVTEAAFGQRRKMLRQSLKGLPGALDVLEPLGIDPQRRAETLDVAEFVAIGARPDAVNAGYPFVSASVCATMALEWPWPRPC